MSRSLRPLYEFFVGAFTVNELRRFVALGYPDLEGEIPAHKVSKTEYALAVAELLARNDAIDDALFAALLREKPRLRAGIEALRRAAVATEAGDAAAGQLDVMFVAANPSALPELGLAAEAGRVEDGLRGTPGERRIRVRHCWRADADALMGALFEGVPDVLHFAGHGARGGALLLQTRGGAAHPVEPTALAALLAARPRRPRVVVLNACHSVVMARALLPLVDAVIGMRDAVEDAAAQKFAVELYRAIGHGCPLKEAFDLGRAALRMCNLANEDMPQLDVRGIDARTYRLL